MVCSRHFLQRDRLRAVRTRAPVRRCCKAHAWRIGCLFLQKLPIPLVDDEHISPEGLPQLPSSPPDATMFSVHWLPDRVSFITRLLPASAIYTAPFCVHCDLLWATYSCVVLDRISRTALRFFAGKLAGEYHKA
jgi:hypothetical protein